MSKKKITLLLIGLIVTASLWSNGTSDLDHEGWRHYENLRRFDGIELRTGARVVIRQGDDWEVKARGDEAELNDLDVYVSNGSLVIKRQSWFNLIGSGRRIEFLITAPRFAQIVNTGPGSIQAEGELESRDLDIRMTGSGSVTVSAISDYLECEITGSGDLDYMGRANRLSLVSQGSGKANYEIRVNVAEVRANGSGNITLRGEGESLEAVLTGTARLSAEEFPVWDATIRTTGSGDADVAVRNSLSATTTGSGSIYYTGNPDSVDVRATGSGQIRGR